MTPVYSIWRLSPLMLLVLAVSACSTVSLEDAMPGARNTGTYPNLNIPTVVATEQLTDEEAASRLAALRTTRGQIKAEDRENKSEAARLRKLGQTHADEAIKKIED